MEYEVVSVLVVLAMVVLAMVVRTKVMDGRHRLPPGPRCWPVVGNMFQLGWSPHESFAKLAHKHGPIMRLWLGSMCTVVISSSEVAREMFKNHDVALAGRKIYEAMRGEHGSEGSLVTSQYDSHWRMLRRLCTSEFFVTSRLDAMRGVRAKCVHRMLDLIEEAGEGGTRAVDVGRFVFLMDFNLIGNLVFSEDLLESETERGDRFYYHALKVMEYAGKPNMADFLPFLKWLDPQGIRRKTQFHVNQAFDIAGSFINERMEKGRDGSKESKDYLDVLLAFRGDCSAEPYTFSSRTINVIIFVSPSLLGFASCKLLFGGTILNKVHGCRKCSLQGQTRQRAQSNGRWQSLCRTQER